MSNLYNKLGDVLPDDLIVDEFPPVVNDLRTIRKLGTAATLKRGTLMARSTGSAGDGKLVILGTTAETNETLVPDCVLADDVEVGTSADVKITPYISGNFNIRKCAVAEGYTITAGDYDEFRKRNIMLRSKLPY